MAARRRNSQGEKMADRKKTGGALGDGRPGRTALDQIRLHVPSRHHKPHPDAVAAACDPIPQSLLALAEELEEALTMALDERRRHNADVDRQLRRKLRNKLH
ncbi:hypothetical protein WG926_17540 [Tistrella sp. BH-R2-4]|jgi:hypothetical protein|uniref:Uncharacterized protein n=1 Tax=Tistrella arctica TaxID=3133430 RepID=A0ABU9YN84_9PROT